MDKKKKKKFLLRIDDDLFNALVTLAEEDCRSVNSEIEYILRQALTERKNKKNQSEPKPHEVKTLNNSETQGSEQIENQNATSTTHWLSSDNIPD